MSALSDLKIVHSYRKRHVFMIFLCSSALFSMIYRFTDDVVLAAVMFSMSFLFMAYAHLGGFIQGIIVQSAHGGNAFPPSNLDSTGHLGIRSFNAWKMLMEERKIAEHNRVVGNKRFEEFLKDLRAEKTEE